MQWFSTSGIFYIIDNVILPLGSSVLIVFFLLFLGRIMRQDQLDIFNDPQVMTPKDARAYLKQVKREKIEKEFDTLCKYEKLKEENKANFLKLREEGVGIKETIQQLSPVDDEDKK